MDKEKKTMIGAVLVQGGGIAGVQASLDLANSGFKVHLVEKSAAIGGMMAHLDKTFPDRRLRHLHRLAEARRMRAESQYRDTHPFRAREA